MVIRLIYNGYQDSYNESFESARILSLTRNEVLYLDSLVSVRAYPDPDEDNGVGFLGWVDLVSKLGMGILRSENTGTVEIEFDDHELWHLRDCSDSTDEYNGEKVGISLRKKLYQALLRKQLAEESDFEDLVSGIGKM